MAFQYSQVPMNLPQKEIRLLRIRPASDGADIHVELKTYHSDNCPSYLAISYTWGDRLPTLRITVNDGEFEVRLNCWYALWQMRYHNPNIAIWIDSICIDQANTDEKNAQVANMGTVYSKADLTACCLGPGHNIAAAQKLMKPPTPNYTPRTLAVERESLRELQHKSYFRRIWIKQEIILSKRIRLYCGVDMLEWDEYVDLLSSFVAHDVRNLRTTLEQHPRSRDLGNNVHAILVNARRLRNANIETTSTPTHHLGPWAELWALLQQYGDAECQDRHDKVYALIPLLRDDVRGRLDLNINYSQSLLELCLEMVQKYIQEVAVYSDSGIIPVEIWETVNNVVQYWIQPKLSNVLSSSFAAQWERLHSPPTLDDRESEDFTRLASTPEYAHMEVWYRYSITGPIDDLFVDEYLRVLEDDADETMPQELEDDQWGISEAMPVEQIAAYLAIFTRADNDFYNSEDDFSISALPPDLPVKAVVCKTPSESRGLYLVPHDINFGDEIVVCRLDNPRVDGFHLPIVRLHAGDQIDERSLHHLLSGWALFLGYDGLLRRSPPVSVFDQPIIEVLQARNPLLRHTSRTASFHVQYEDLILNAILLQDVSAYLTHPRTHKTRPSFLAESPVGGRGKGKTRVENTDDKKERKSVGFT